MGHKGGEQYLKKGASPMERSGFIAAPIKRLSVPVSGWHWNGRPYTRRIYKIRTCMAQGARLALWPTSIKKARLCRTKKGAFHEKRNMYFWHFGVGITGKHWAAFCADG
jgi:hypothetical protein